MHNPNNETDINAFRDRLKQIYGDSFTEETKRLLKEIEQIENKNKQQALYHNIAANCAIYIVQKSLEISATTLDFFRHVPYYRYINEHETLEFKITHGKKLKKVKDSITNTLNAVIPATYAQLGFNGVCIDFDPSSYLKISKYFVDTECSHLEMPMLLASASMSYYKWTIDRIEDNTITQHEVTRELVKKLSLFVVTAHGLHNMLFEFKRYMKPD